MRRLVAAPACAVLGLMAGAQPSWAEISYPWCAQYGSLGGRNCGFSTLQQCQAAISGNGGYCEQNPMYLPEAGRMGWRKPRR